MQQKNFVKIQDGSYLNMNMVIRFKLSGKTIYAECPSQTVTMLSFPSNEEAKDAFDNLMPGCHDVTNIGKQE